MPATVTPADLLDQPARYRGSLTDYHGPARVVGICDCDDCWDADSFARLTTGQPAEPRYELAVPSGHLLRHVRRASFTVAGQ